MAGAHIRFNDDYEMSDSDEDCTEKEKDLLKKVRNRYADNNSDSEEEVYALKNNSEDEDDDDVDDDNDDDASDIADSDIEGQYDDDIPDVRAWGQHKKSFYSTDYVDPDYGSYQGKDAVAADLEEEEARNIQKRLIEQMDDDDFELDFLKKSFVEKPIEVDEELIKTDLSLLSKRQLLELLEKESPEFFQLVNDFKSKLSVAKNNLLPIIEQIKQGKIQQCKAVEFVQIHYGLIMNYCTNIYMYLYLKASRINLQNHPIIKRLYQYRQLLSQLEPIYTEIIKPQIDIIIEVTNKIPENKPTKNIKKVNLLTNLNKLKRKKTIKDDDEDNVDLSLKKQKIESPEPVDEEKPDNEESKKRAITYQISKNKGLMPHRKKEQRNPRVKYRNKYRKAQIRRKGAVREVRKELSKYAGEISGIKTSVTKSIKFK